MLVRCAAFQVSCLGVEPAMDGDDARFVLTSRNPDGSVVRFQLLASSPETCRAWINDVGQILESQRNFLNGEGPRLTLIPQHFYVVGLQESLLLLCVCQPYSRPLSTSGERASPIAWAAA